MWFIKRCDTTHRHFPYGQLQGECFKATYPVNIKSPFSEMAEKKTKFKACKTAFGSVAWRGWGESGCQFWKLSATISTKHLAVQWAALKTALTRTLDSAAGYDCLLVGQTSGLPGVPSQFRGPVNPLCGKNTQKRGAFTEVKSVSYSP